MTTKLININSGQKYDVFIGRPSRYGNPFTHRKDLSDNLAVVSSRKEAIDEYRVWVYNQPDMIEDIKINLKNKVLG